LISDISQEVDALTGMPMTPVEYDREAIRPTKRANKDPLPEVSLNLMVEMYSHAYCLTGRHTGEAKEDGRRRRRSKRPRQPQKEGPRKTKEGRRRTRRSQPQEEEPQEEEPQEEEPQEEVAEGRPRKT
jgi:hypothetical protein